MAIKTFKSPTYNYAFDTKDGLFARWGKTPKDDPQCAPSPELLDIEISTVCHKACSWCYKSNTAQGHNMSLVDFKHIIDLMPSTLTQVALGTGDVDANPELESMFAYCRSKDIVPNITINGSRMTPGYYGMLAHYCGAVAVSNYGPECYEAVSELSRRGLRQVNIHALLSLQTLAGCHQVLADKAAGHPKLEGLNAVVFLWLKPKGARNDFHQITANDLDGLVLDAINKGVSFGFDSCSAHNFQSSISRLYKRGLVTSEMVSTTELVTEPCESSAFSWYIDAEGRGFPCSFAAGITMPHGGLNVLECENFIKDIWQAQPTKLFRRVLLNNKRHCPLYDLEVEL